jgi:hypothetical protein
MTEPSSHPGLATNYVYFSILKRGKNPKQGKKIVKQV